MSIVAMASTSAGSPQTVYTGSARVIRCFNPDAAITIHVHDGLCNAAGVFADIPAGGDHVFVRPRFSATGNITAYADSGTPNLIVNEMGGNG